MSLCSVAIANHELFVTSFIERLLQQSLNCFCFCGGARNIPLGLLLEARSEISFYTHFEERSAAFFALGKSRATDAPVAVITSSGPAAAELFSTLIEAYYTNTPLIAITADRPSAYRGTGAPQVIDQRNLFGLYTPNFIEIEDDLEPLDRLFSHWDRRSPLHINICLKDPRDYPNLPPPGPLENFISFEKEPVTLPLRQAMAPMGDPQLLAHLLESSQRPFAVVGTLSPYERPIVEQFLLTYNIPALLEATSGLRESSALSKCTIRQRCNLHKAAQTAHYPFDLLLRIGGVPCNDDLWRHIDRSPDSQTAVLSVSQHPFAGAISSKLITSDLSLLTSPLLPHKTFTGCEQWIHSDHQDHAEYINQLNLCPESEATIVHTLSKIIPSNARLFLGNSLPIREWDLTACYTSSHSDVWASRGINGIDGQLSTFFGCCSTTKENWGLFGDLTTLYDLAAPWILPQLQTKKIVICLLNNGRGAIFDSLSTSSCMKNAHTLSCQGWAAMWNLHYTPVKQGVFPSQLALQPGNHLVEFFI